MTSSSISDFISILIGSRGRQSQLNNFLESIEETTTAKGKLEFALYVDEDDLETQEYLNANIKRFSFSIRPCIKESPIALGEIQNTLWKTSLHRGGLFVTAMDDYIYTTKGWDEQIRDAFSKYPDRIALVYPEDPTAPELATMPILSDQWITTVGTFQTDYFPFWYNDVWLDEVAQMVQRKHKIDMKVSTQGGKGKTARMRNLPFWQRFFLMMIIERLSEAEKLRSVIYKNNQSLQKESESMGRSLALKFLEMHDHSDEKLITSEQELAASTNWSDPRKLYSYITSELRAVHRASELLTYAFRMDDYGFIARALDVISRASLSIPELDIFRNAISRQTKLNYRALPEFKLPAQ